MKTTLNVLKILIGTSNLFALKACDRFLIMVIIHIFMNKKILLFLRMATAFIVFIVHTFMNKKIINKETEAELFSPHE